MPFGCVMPRHHDQIWIEHVIDHILKQIDTFVTVSIHDTPFEYWLLDVAGRFVTAILMVILCIPIWTIKYSLRPALSSTLSRLLYP
jgi:hypothetical protein